MNRTTEIDRAARTFDLLILGGGPAGVGAAYRAAGKGLSVGLLERSGRVGGAAGSFKVGGMRVDHGSHRLHPSTDPQILDELRSLLGADLQTRRRHGRIRIANRWIAFPLKATDLMTRLPLPLAAAAARDAATSPMRKKGGRDFAEVLLSGVGPAVAENLYFPYAKKLWGLDPGEISAEQARRRVSANSPGKLFRRILSGKSGAGRTFYYPAGGFGQICERLAEAARDAGAEIHLGTEVSRIAFSRNCVEVEDSSGNLRQAGLVFSTLPLSVLARIADPPDGEAAEAAGRLEFRAMILVYLVVDQDRYTEFDAHYIPGGPTPVTRISEPKNYRNGPDPAGTTVLCAEIPCSRHDAIWDWQAGRLGDLVLEALSENELPPVRPVEVLVKKIPFVYPVYRKGYESAFEALDRWAGSLPALLTFGRLGLFAHDNTHHALSMAWSAVDAISGGGIDLEYWAAARERFAGHVVED
ncbi:MAG: protoporphyrinogen/coproporphyrinogen oxidase [Actinomycetota bacterium]